MFLRIWRQQSPFNYIIYCLFESLLLGAKTYAPKFVNKTVL